MSSSTVQKARFDAPKRKILLRLGQYAPKLLTPLQFIDFPFHSVPIMPHPNISCYYPNVIFLFEASSSYPTRATPFFFSSIPPLQFLLNPSTNIAIFETLKTTQLCDLTL
ncbi:Bgt-20567 [Blumeria graminis f. sp. tritici]|uniref:Bgt-20567 n=2 Tax=Blumeria graminis f. sp. tritici TaxID=62690 RepID=A0A9X9MIT5_BLUGR|nr:Bgt-20567 [Blumeria graminis f. sp. tritici]